MVEFHDGYFKLLVAWFLRLGVTFFRVEVMKPLFFFLRDVSSCLSLLLNSYRCFFLLSLAACCRHVQRITSRIRECLSLCSLGKKVSRVVSCGDKDGLAETFAECLTSKQDSWWLNSSQSCQHQRKMLLPKRATKTKQKQLVFLRVFLCLGVCPLCPHPLFMSRCVSLWSCKNAVMSGMWALSGDSLWRWRCPPVAPPALCLLCSPLPFTALYRASGQRRSRHQQTCCFNTSVAAVVVLSQNIMWSSCHVLLELKVILILQ